MATNYATATVSTSTFWKPSSYDDDHDDHNNVADRPLFPPTNDATDPLSAHGTPIQILHALETHRVLVLVDHNDEGDAPVSDVIATRLPLYLYDHGWADGDEREILVATPDETSAQTSSRQLSSHLASRGLDASLVGHSFGFSNDVRPGATKIRYVTAGYLLREALLADPLWGRCSVLIVDGGAGGRSAETEVLLGVVKRVLRRRRREWRVVVRCGEGDAEAVLQYFTSGSERRKKRRRKDDSEEGEEGRGKVRKRKSRWGRVEDAATDSTNAINTTNATNKSLEEGTILSIGARPHPVDIFYVQQPVSDYVQSAVETALQIHSFEQDQDDHSGDILCLLPTENDVEDAVSMAETALSAPSQQPRTKPAVCLPLHASLPSRLRSQPFLPPTPEELRTRSRRIVFATHAENLPNVSHVVDAGFVQTPFFDPSSGCHRSIVHEISRTDADRRARRAGTLRPGKCYRLYSEEYLCQSMVETTPPEMRRCDLTQVILTIKALGVTNVLSFDWMTLPTAEALAYGLECLFALGVLDDNTELTELGKEMVYFPTDPRTSRMILAALDMESRFYERDNDDPYDDPYDENGISSMTAKLIVGDIITVAAAMQVRSLLYSPKNERQWTKYDDAMADILDRSGDHVTLVHLFDLLDHTHRMLSEDECRERFVNRGALHRAMDVRNQLHRFLKRRFGSGRYSNDWLGSTRREIVGSHGFDSGERSEAIRKCVCAGFFMNVAKLNTDGRYYTLRGKYAVSISPSSVIHRYGDGSDYVVFGETCEGARGGVDVRTCSSINGLWLRQLVPHYWK